MKLSTVTNQHNGLTYMVRIVELNDSYGHGMALTHTSTTPMVEFYDTRYKFDSDGGIILGQFVSRYNMNIIKEHGPNGLCLMGGVMDWIADNQAMTQLQALLVQWGFVK